MKFNFPWFKRRIPQPKNVCSIQISQGVAHFTTPTTCVVTFAEEPEVAAFNWSTVYMHPDSKIWRIAETHAKAMAKAGGV